MNSNINWSEKVKNLDENIRKEIGIENEVEAKHILIKVQTKSPETIEPAFIVGEDDLFLDLLSAERTLTLLLVAPQQTRGRAGVEGLCGEPLR